MPAAYASLTLNVFDGARQPIASSLRVLVRLIDGVGRTVSAGYHRGPSIYFARVPCYGDSRDDYRIVVSAPGCHTAGFHPLRMAAGRLTNLDLMLLPRDGTFNFRPAAWSALAQTRSRWLDLLERESYERLMEEQPAALAGLLNLLTALEQVQLGQGVPLDYLAGIIWDPSPAPDRFFGWARPSLLDEVEKASHAGLFRAEMLPGVFHPGATSSFKETRLPFANLQITFHGNQWHRIGESDCVKVEPDIDYYPELVAHATLEVLPNKLLRRKTDPRMVYMLRWVATRWTGVPEFAPPYTVC